MVAVPRAAIDDVQVRLVATRWTRQAQGGHYAAIVMPDLFVEGVRTFARMLCETRKAG